MATKDSNIKQDIRFFEELFPKYRPDASIRQRKEAYEYCIDGTLQIETMLENAIEMVGGPKKTSKDGMDFDDKSDAKKVSTTMGSGDYRKGQITGISNKEGALRVMMFEQISNKFYYFYIPHSTYQHCEVAIEIKFELDGTPKYNTAWWEYEVDTFEDMALTLSLKNNYLQTLLNIV